GSLGEGAAGYIERNRAAWERWAKEYIVAGRKAWSAPELRWGIWGIPESELGLVEGVPPGSDVVELGCGTAAISAALARAGLRPVAIDISRAQLDLAAEHQREFGPVFPLVHANAEQVPFDTESFDVAISEYGASLWCDPRRWLPEAHRLLRPNGRLIFIVNGALLMVCTPADGSRAGDRLVREYFASPAMEFPEDGVVEFHLTHGQWVRILRKCGFVLDDLVEVRPPHGAKPRFDFVSVEWARRWPSEEIWIARKVA
ncbi:MAG TPA: class I SAM-dependent methyltransferase, partial [Gaiellaceae bacterium]|nr:class I SAM-dependent methyltransferase [Gaiellaceae bacterium]